MNELSLYILDIAENSINANSCNLYIDIIQNEKENTLKLVFKDDGRGMDSETLKKVTDPFYTTRTTRKVGLGIPLFKELAELCEGEFNIESKIGVGTTTTATFKLDSIDLPPLGSIDDTLYCLMANKENCEVHFRFIKNENEFQADTISIKEALDGVPIDEPDVVLWLKDYIKEGIKNLDIV